MRLGQGQHDDLTAVPSGGATTITAKVERSTTCSLSAIPGAPGLPITLGCQAGTTAVPVRKTISLPALGGSFPFVYQLTLKVTGPGGTDGNLVAQTVYPKMSFSVDGA